MKASWKINLDFVSGSIKETDRNTSIDSNSYFDLDSAPFSCDLKENLKECGCFIITSNDYIDRTWSTVKYHSLQPL